MFHPTPSLGRSLRRLALTTKNGPKDYYKGTGSGSMGRHTRFGGYEIDMRKVRTYVPPVMMDTCEVCLFLQLVSYMLWMGLIYSIEQLTPFVANRVPKESKKRLVDRETGEFINDPKTDGRLFLRQWKEFNGNEQPEEYVEPVEEGLEEGLEPESDHAEIPVAETRTEEKSRAQRMTTAG